MEKYEVISRVYKYLFMDTKLLCLWLHENLPCVTRGWWDKCVIPALTDDQKVMTRDNYIDGLDELDLAMMINVGVANWFAISDRNPGQSVKRGTLSDMLQVRNNWAHFTSEFPGTDTILSDLRTIADLHGQLGGKKSDRDEMAGFIRELEKTGITDSVSRESDAVARQTITTSIYPETMSSKSSGIGVAAKTKNVQSCEPGTYQKRNTDANGNLDLASLRPGLHVRHTMKGDGVILSVDKNKKITVKFADGEAMFDAFSVFVKKSTMVVTD
ncbi:MAG: hypothetical protein LUD72_03810 [Bacteroidales bacterium]|nr:hypothetical protein [Bacteroidales bacterium]